MYIIIYVRYLFFIDTALPYFQSPLSIYLILFSCCIFVFLYIQEEDQTGLFIIFLCSSLFNSINFIFSIIHLLFIFIHSSFFHFHISSIIIYISFYMIIVIGVYVFVACVYLIITITTRYNDKISINLQMSQL